MTMKKTKTLSSLPMEMLIKIFARVDIRSALRCESVCRVLFVCVRAPANDQYVWKAKAIAVFCVGEPFRMENETWRALACKSFAWSRPWKSGNRCTILHQPVICEIGSPLQVEESMCRRYLGPPFLPQHVVTPGGKFLLRRTRSRTGSVSYGALNLETEVQEAL